MPKEDFENEDYYESLIDAISSKRDEEKENFLREFIESAKEVAKDPNSASLAALVEILQKDEFYVFLYASQNERDDFLVDLINIAKEIVRAQNSQYPDLLIEMISQEEASEPEEEVESGSESEEELEEEEKEADHSRFFLFYSAATNECANAVTEYIKIAKEIADAENSEHPNLFYDMLSDCGFAAFIEAAENRCIEVVTVLIDSVRKIAREPNSNYPELLSEMFEAQDYGALAQAAREDNAEIMDKLIVELDKEGKLKDAVETVAEEVYKGEDTEEKVRNFFDDLKMRGKNGGERDLVEVSKESLGLVESVILDEYGPIRKRLKHNETSPSSSPSHSSGAAAESESEEQEPERG